MGVKEIVELSVEEAMNLTVTTASRYQEKISDTPSTVIVISKQQIQERGYTNLLQVLEGLPNVDIQRYGAQGTSEQISIRGIAKNNGFLILQDGIRINSPTGEPIPVNDNFPVHYAKRIEVVFGPASVMYGADALTGAINIISETAEDINGVEVKGIVGEYNTYHSQIKAGKKFNDNFSITAGGHYKESDNANLASYYPNEYRLNDLTTFSGETVVKAQDRTGYRGDTQSYSAFSKLTFFKDLDIGMNYAFDKHRSDVGGLPDYVDYGAKAYLNTELGTAYADYKLHINNELSGFLRGNYSWYDLLPESRYINKYDNFSGGYKYSFGERKQLEAQLQYQVSSDHTVSGGVSLAKFESIPKTPDLTIPYAPDKSPTQQNQFYAGTDNSLPLKIQHLRYNNIGVYLQWNANWNSWFSTSMAVRYDKDSRYKNTINPKLGLVFKPTDKITSKFLYGTAFLAPSPLFSGEHYGAFSEKKGNSYSSDFFHIPNSHLKPETIETFEFSADYQAAKKLNIGFSIYHNTLTGIISSTLTAPPVSNYIPGGLIRTTEHNDNIGRLISYGGDIHFDYQYSFLDSDMKLWGNYSYSDGSLTQKSSRASMRLPLVADHKIKLGLTYTYQDKYSITPKLYWIGKTNTSQASLAATNVLQTLPSYFRLDLYAAAKIAPNFSLIFTVNNLLDKHYYNAGNPDNGVFVGSPQDPRTISAGFTYQFGN